MRNYLLFVLLLFVLQSCVKDQFSLKNYETGNFIVIQKGCRIKFKAYVIDKKIDAKEDKTYYWYFDNKIQYTKGGHSGKVLHGTYEEYYPEGQLKAKGEFKNGLKQKTWKDYHVSGYLEYVVNFHNGDTSGKVEHLDANGELVEYVLPFKLARKAKEKAEKDQIEAKQILQKKEERKIKSKAKKNLKLATESNQGKQDNQGNQENKKFSWKSFTAKIKNIFKKKENKDSSTKKESSKKDKK